MGKIYPSDREIFNSFLNDADKSFIRKKEKLKLLHNSFDRSGALILKDKDSADWEAFFTKLAHMSQGKGRYIGFSGLIHCTSSSGLLWEAFEDPYFPCRCLAVEKLESSNRHKLFNEIFKRLINDPRQFVRDRALARIRQNFADIFTYRIENFTPEQQYRLLLHLSCSQAYDRDVLLNFLSSDQNDLSSRSAYCLQKENMSAAGDHWSKASDLNLLRYFSLEEFCKSGHPLFEKALEQIDNETPRKIQNDFISELAGSPYLGDRISSYEKAVDLIRERKDEGSASLWMALWNNQNLRENQEDLLLSGFSQANQYYCAPLLIQLMNKEKNYDKKEKYRRAAECFTFPINA